ncbi:uncharacterized protein TNCV_112281 [Trichonephila clavipes]|nr:uncharacterized protein TNCV_112281 [Trichonephila clavipes]
MINFFIPELNNHDVQELWFQQDGATCHTARATIDLLKDTLGDRLISRFGPVNWPPRSCDSTPLDYFLWGYVKSLVYADKPQMLEKVIENWTSRLDYIRASRDSPMPEIIFKMSSDEHDTRDDTPSSNYPTDWRTLRLNRFNMYPPLYTMGDYTWANLAIFQRCGCPDQRSFSNRASINRLSCQVIYSQFGLAIHQNDHQARRRFVEWAQNEIAVVPDFHKRILFSDEAHFWLNGYVNKQNCRIWSEANPQVYVETPLHPEKLTVWCALWADYFLWGYVKSLVYADKPQTLDHLEDNTRRVIADIRPQMLEKVIENWTSRLDYIRASRGSHMPDIIFKM